MAGSTGNANLVSSGVQYALFIVFTGAVFFFIEIGRRPLLINSALGMGICQFVICGVLCSYGTYVPGGVLGNLNVIVKVTDGRAHTVIAFVYLLIIVYAVALALVAWVYSRRAQRAWRSRRSESAFQSRTWVICSPAFGNISWKTFVIFGTLCFGAATQAFFTYPETAGKSIEEIEILFANRGPRPWKTNPGNSGLNARIDAFREMREKGVEIEKVAEIKEVENKDMPSP